MLTGTTPRSMYGLRPWRRMLRAARWIGKKSYPEEGPTESSLNMSRSMTHPGYAL